MRWDPNLRIRAHPRLATRDYARQCYHVTLCTHGRRPIFGDRVDGVVVLNDLGRHVAGLWQKIGDVYPTVRIDEFVVVPEHVHGILHLGVGGGPSKDLGTIINQFKGIATKDAARKFGAHPGPLWQRGFHERCIRPGGMDAVRDYIARHRMPHPIDTPISGPQTSA